MEWRINNEINNQFINANSLRRRRRTNEYVINKNNLWLYYVKNKKKRERERARVKENRIDVTFNWHVEYWFN